MLMFALQSHTMSRSVSFSSCLALITFGKTSSLPESGCYWSAASMQQTACNTACVAASRESCPRTNAWPVLGQSTTKCPSTRLRVGAQNIQPMPSPCPTTAWPAGKDGKQLYRQQTKGNGERQLGVLNRVLQDHAVSGLALADDDDTAKYWSWTGKRHTQKVVAV